MRMMIAVALMTSATIMLSLPACSQTLDRRVKALEDKTNYYEKKNKVFRKTKNRANTAGYQSRGENCDDLQVTIDPKLSVGGTIYGWARVSITYSGAPTKVGATLITSMGGIGFGETVPVSQSSGVVEVKVFGAWPAKPGITIFVSGSAYKVAGSETGSCVDKMDVTLKTTLIEVAEPDF